MNFNEFTVPGYIDVKVVSSTRALPQANDDGPVYMQRAERVTVDVLANDFNPFAQDGVPLRVIAAAIDQVDVGSNASVSFTDTGITVRTGAAFTGTLSVIYRIQDGTRDAARETQGRVTVIVRDEPDAPNAPASSRRRSGAATVSWGAPATNNSPITRYEVSWNGGSQIFDASAAGVDQSIGGLTNGTTYTFTVRAENGIGWSAPSGGTSATPYGQPSEPRNLAANAAGYAPTTVNVDWNAPSDTGGGGVHYEARIAGGNWKHVSGTSDLVRRHRRGHAPRRRARGQQQRRRHEQHRVGQRRRAEPSAAGAVGHRSARDRAGRARVAAAVAPRCASRWSDMDPGRYRVYATINGGACCGYQQDIDHQRERAAAAAEPPRHPSGRRDDRGALRERQRGHLAHPGRHQRIPVEQPRLQHMVIARVTQRTPHTSKEQTWQ